jgi:hypothetical protein
MGRSNTLRARRYLATGQPVGPDFQVNTRPLGWSRDNVATAAATYRADGAVLVVWAAGSGAQGEVRGQLFAADWTRLGSELTLSASTGGERDTPSVVATSSGGFYVTWQGPGTVDPDGIHARRLDANGVPVGAEWQVNEGAAGAQANAQAAISPRDELLVVWQSPDASGTGVFARMHDRNGTPAGPEVQVNQFSSGDQRTSWNGGRTGVMFAGETIFISWWGNVPGDSSGVGLSVLKPLGALYELFGAGCPGSRGTPPILSAHQPPRVGQSLTLRVTAMPPHAPGAVLPFSLSRTRWGLFILPLDLGPIGMPGCWLLASGEPNPTPVQADAGGVATLTLPIPNDPTLDGLEFFNQALVVDLGVNPAGVTVSNGGRGVISR